MIDRLNVQSVKVSKERAAEQWNHLLNIVINLPEHDGSDVKVLVRSDMTHLLIHLDVPQGRWDEPISVKAPLGGPCLEMWAMNAVTPSMPTSL